MNKSLIENNTCLQLFNAINWDKHTLGNRHNWPVSLQTTLGILFNSKFPMFLFWGPDHYCFYNDAYLPSLGNEGKHPRAMGSKAKEVWPEIWDIIYPQIAQILNGGPATWHQDALVPIFRNGRIEDVYWTYSYSPVINEGGEIAGVFVTCNETTGKVIAVKQMQELSAKLVLHSNELIDVNQHLATQNEVLKKAEEIAHLGIFEWILATGKVIWSEQLFKILGHNPDTTIPSFSFALNNVVKKDEQENVVHKIEQCKINGQPYSDEISIVRPDGSIRNIEIEAHFEYDKNNQPVKMVGVILDITDRKKNTSEINELASIIQNSLNEIYIFDTHTFKFSFVNKGALANIGYSMQEMQEMTPLSIKPEYTIEDFNKIIQPLLSGEQQIQVFNTVHQRKNGSLYPAEIHLQKMSFQLKPAFVAVIIDVTEQNKKEQATADALQLLKASEAKYKMLFENSPLPKMIYELDTLQILDVNEASVKLYGYSKNEFQKLNLKVLRPLHELPELLKKIKKLKKATGLQTYGPVCHIKKNGKTFYAEVNEHLISVNTHKAALAVITDISAKLDAEIKLNELNQSLLASNLELQNFASITAHDLQEPLRMVSSFTSQLNKKYGNKLDEKARQYIRFAVDGAQRMHILIKDILEYAQVGSGSLHKETINVNEVYQQAVTDLSVQIQNQGARINIPQIRISINGNKSWLYRLFINLFSNALKFSVPGRNAVVELAVTDTGSHWQFTVTDNGIGISPDDISRLFKTYSRLHSSKDFAGTGLGLATCKKIVELHGGTIHVESKPEKGSSFIFTLMK